MTTLFIVAWFLAGALSWIHHVLYVEKDDFDVLAAMFIPIWGLAGGFALTVFSLIYIYSEIPWAKINWDRVLIKKRG